MSGLKVLIGLGNPGAEHEGQRHNAGFWLVDAVLRAHGGSLRSESKLHGECGRVSIAGQDLLLVTPGTFMNRSGRCAQAVAAYFKISPADIFVAHDELDLPAGVVRLKRGGGHGGHNGLRDISQHLGADYARIRLGIGHPGDKSQVLNYVLGRPSSNDERLIRDGLADTVAMLPQILTDWDKAAQSLHTKKPEEQNPGLKQDKEQDK